MSIIYEALKKVEGSFVLAQEKKPAAEDKSGPKRYSYFLYLLLIVAAGFLAANTVFNLLSGQVKNTAPAPLAVTAAPPADTAVVLTYTPPPQPPAFTLNGIFFSQEEGFALINNQIVKNGDEVDGAKVVRIGPDEVELEAAGLAIKLSCSK
jgi:hypothetical protein